MPSHLPTPRRIHGAPALLATGRGATCLHLTPRRGAHHHFFLSTLLGLLTGQALAAPVNGDTVVSGDVSIVSSSQSSYASWRDFVAGSPHTPFVLTRGDSNAVHGQPSNPVGGGYVYPGTMDASNALVPANIPLNLLDRTQSDRWDLKPFAYAVGDGPSFKIGAGTSAWGVDSSASYGYEFKHFNASGQTEQLSPIALHLDRGEVLVLPSFGYGGDTPSFFTDIRAHFSYQVQVYVEDGLPDGSNFSNFVQKDSAGVSAVLSKKGVESFGDGFTLPPGLHAVEGGEITAQRIPEQVLTLEQFDLLPFQRLTIHVDMSVSVGADGFGPQPFIFAVAGDPLSLTSGAPQPNVLLQFAPVPEPAIGLMLPAGLAGLWVARRRHALA